MILKKKLEKYRNLPLTRTFPETRTELKDEVLGFVYQKKTLRKRSCGKAGTKVRDR